MKICHISDTHSNHRELILPESDILICSGDVSYNKDTFIDFLEWFSKQEAKYKIFVSGNHEEFPFNNGYQNTFDLCNDYGVIYLEDTEVIIEGLKFYGSPWTSEFRDFYFIKTELGLEEVWDKIPDDIDILITHSPAFGVLDRLHSVHLGSPSLEDRLKELKHLTYHFFGHIHNDYGVKGEYNSNYVSVNGAQCCHLNRLCGRKIPVFYI